MLPSLTSSGLSTSPSTSLRSRGTSIDLELDTVKGNGAVVQIENDRRQATYDFFVLLVQCCQQRSSDAPDKVYGLLGLLRPSVAVMFPPDYSLDGMDCYGIVRGRLI